MAVDAASLSPLQFQSLKAIRLSDDERISQTISKENTGKAINALHKDGIVCLSNAVDPDHIDILHDRLAPEVEIMRDSKNTYWNNNSDDGSPTGNMAQGPPRKPELMFDDVWANGPALAIIAGILGPNPRVNFVGGNTVIGSFSGARQNVHPDLTFNHAVFPFAYCANVYLNDTSVENGSTELWLGSHRDCSFAQQEPMQKKPGEPATRFGIKKELLEERRRFAPPIQPSIPRGSVVIRDMRLWHAGLPSRSPEPRIMLAFVHTPWWYDCPTEVWLPETSRPLVERWAKRKHPVLYHHRFQPAGMDDPPFTPDFDTGNETLKMLLSKKPNEN